MMCLPRVSMMWWENRCEALHCFPKHLKVVTHQKYWRVYLLSRWRHAWSMWWKHQETKIMNEMTRLRISWCKRYKKLSALYKLHLSSWISSFAKALLCKITNPCLIREQKTKNGFYDKERKREKLISFQQKHFNLQYFFKKKRKKY